MDADRIKDTARLAGIELTEVEAIEFAGQLGSVLALFAGIEQVDLEGVEPLATPPRAESALRRDSPGDEAATDSGAMRKSFTVPRVLPEGR